MKQKLCMIIRYITVPPMIASAFLLTVQLTRPEVFGEIYRFFCCLVFIGLFPLLAYPLQRFFPHFRDKGRLGQRSLAILFSVAGYLLACLCACLTDAPVGMWFVIFSYMASGLCIAVSNAVFHFKISGHACGVVGPAAIGFCFGMYIYAAIGAVLTVLVFYASRMTGRHTVWQLIGGSIAPIIIVFLLGLTTGLC